MNIWEQIKKTLEQEGDKSVIVIEGGKVSYLIKKLDHENKEKDNSSEYKKNHETEDVNKDIEEYSSVGSGENFQTEEEVSDVKVEDLPF